MKVLNFGSLNIDHVYRVEDFVAPGATLATLDYQQYVGGKGLNQSLALARAGAQVVHVGCTGHNDSILQQTLSENGVDIANVVERDCASGHAIIQVNAAGDNCILIHGGANQMITDEQIDGAFASAEKGDVLLLQNEINKLPVIIDTAAEHELTIVFNPAPMSAQVSSYPLDKIDYFVLNETEAQALSGAQNPQGVLSALQSRFPDSAFILTLGERGAIYQQRAQQITVPAVASIARDTTAAGDTFTGYFVAELCAGKAIRDCLETACKAASICVQHAGAANSIPWRNELEEASQD